LIVEIGAVGFGYIGRLENPIKS